MPIDTFYVSSFGGIPVDISYQTPGGVPIGDKHRCYYEHVQNSVELLLIRRGAVDVSVNDTWLYAGVGDILLFNPLDRHAIYCAEAVDNVEYYCLIFEPPHFVRVLPPDAAERLRRISGGTLRFTGKIAADDENGALIRELIPLLLPLHMAHDAIAETKIAGYICLMLAELLGHYCIDALTDGIFNRNFDFIRRVIELVDAHYREPLTTASVSEALSYSKSYFCHRFRESFATTFSEYLLRHRCERAASMRGRENLTLIGIAEYVGFSDYAYFSRSFRKYIGKTPREYFDLSKL